MEGNQLAVTGEKLFESLKKLNDLGREYWSAREIQSPLGYAEWRNFGKAIKKAITSCEQSGNDPGHHFVDVNKMIGVGKGGQRKTTDYHLSRFACYLIALNGDPDKPEIAHAQKYFVVQARRQELSDEMAADRNRIEERSQASVNFKDLSGAARHAGVQDRMFGVFHDAGYKGMYGGLGRTAIKAKKNIPAKDELMDRMDATELAANNFRMTQTRDKLMREGVRDQAGAINVHNEVGKEVRAAINKIGGTLPENIKPAEHIKAVKKRLRTSKPKLKLDDDTAKGLLGSSEAKKSQKLLTVDDL